MNIKDAPSMEVKSSAEKTKSKQRQNNNIAQHHGTITHLVLHQLELYYRKTQTRWRGEG
jgi:hypothetical protein